MDSVTVPSDILATPISQPLPTSSIRVHLAASPWHQVSGTFNFRNTSCPPQVKKDLIYRSGMLTSLSDQGKDVIVRSLGIRAVYDLRFTEERERDPEPILPGVTMLGAQADDVDRDWDSLAAMYMFFLEAHRDIFREIFLHVLHQPNEPFLIHCTAGKDRTAVAVALLLLVAGVPKEVITYDYSLTRLGIEPVRELLEAKLASGFNGKEIDWDSKAIKIMAGCEAETMTSFIQMIEDRFEGGAEGYVMKELEFSREDIEAIKRNLADDHV